MRLFRILGKSISNAFKSIVRNFSLSLASISCTAITLILVSIALLATYNVNSMTKNIEGSMTIIAFIDENATDEEIEKTRTLLEECLKSYHYLEKTQVECDEVKINIEEKATFITIKRDMKTFSHGELRLINTLINEEFGKLLIMDTDKIPMIDSTMLAQMDLIDTMFASLKINPVVEKMIGIREAGRVIVFNK